MFCLACLAFVIPQAAAVSIITELYVLWVLFKAMKGDAKDELLGGQCVLESGLRTSVWSGFEEDSTVQGPS
jgi:hypothetical protein